MKTNNLPTYNVNLADNPYISLQNLPFFDSFLGLRGLPETYYEAGAKVPAACLGDLADVVMQRFYKLGEVYAIAFMHRLYINHHTEIFEDIKAYLQGSMSAYDLWGGDDLHHAIRALTSETAPIPEDILTWVNSGFFAGLQRFLIMAVLPQNSLLNPAFKLEKLTPDDINAMIMAVLNDERLPEHPFQSIEGWSIA